MLLRYSIKKRPLAKEARDRMKYTIMIFQQTQVYYIAFVSKSQLFFFKNFKIKRIIKA